MSEHGASIAIVDDHPVVVEAIRLAFLARTSFDIPATGGTAEDARIIAERHRPDIMLMDLSLPGDVFGTIKQIAEARRTKVIVFTAHSSLDAARRALDAGALGFVLKGADFDELFKAIQYVLNDELYIAPEVASQVLTALRARRRPEELSVRRLSARESQIVGLLLNAKSNREIAQTLAVSEKTVKRYVTVLMQKMHARNRIEVAVNARKSFGGQFTGREVEQR